jgi:hypothetical protein
MYIVHVDVSEYVCIYSICNIFEYYCNAVHLAQLDAKMSDSVYSSDLPK